MSLNKIDYKVTCEHCGVIYVTRYVVECDFCGKRHYEKFKAKESPKEALKSALADGFSFSSDNNKGSDLLACEKKDCIEKFDKKCRCVVNHNNVEGN